MDDFLTQIDVPICWVCRSRPATQEGMLSYVCNSEECDDVDYARWYVHGVPPRTTEPQPWKESGF